MSNIEVWHGAGERTGQNTLVTPEGARCQSNVPGGTGKDADDAPDTTRRWFHSDGSWIEYHGSSLHGSTTVRAAMTAQCLKHHLLHTTTASRKARGPHSIGNIHV